MKLLVLGGTEFVGRALVSEGLRRGWDVTTFTRGRHARQPGVRSLVGDRSMASGLDALLSADTSWDVAVDTWSWAPSAVRDTTAALRDRVRRYVYISSCSVYRFPSAAGSDETASLVEGSPDDDTFDDYARAKAGAERAVEDTFGEHALLARPGLILGPHENIGRLPWWLLRGVRGGQILAPGTPGAGIQYIDARDLASWCLDAAEAEVSGPVNTISPPTATTMGELLDACLTVTGSAGRLNWVPTTRILDAGIEPWSQLPMWLPPGEMHDSMFQIDVSRALSTGLTIRPIDETVADTWRWLDGIGRAAPQRPDRPPVGLDPEIEASLLGDR